MPVQTHLGIGEIVERSSVRGRSQVRVAGRGFSVWLDAKDVRTAAGTYENDLASETVNESNSTTLPYNPDPQVEGILDTQSTIVPGDHEIDPDERLHPSDSLTFDSRSEDTQPAPSPDLFAKGAGREVREQDEPPICPCGKHYVAPGFTHKDWEKWTHQADQDYFVDDPEAGFDKLVEGSLRHAGPELVLPVADEALPEVLPPILGQGDEEEDPREDTSFGGNHSDLVQHGIDESPLGPIVEPLQKVLGSRGDLTEALGPKYATWMLEARVDHYNDPIQRFRDDPEGEIQRLGHIMSDTLDEDTKHYGMLIEADRELREAAWTDVRAKASRLREAGAVHVLDYSPGQIFASVDGDHGTYDVMVKRGNEYTGDNKVSDWLCGCRWGSWAFRRQFKFVGRLCSHGLAALDEMQSRDHQGNPGKFQRLRLASKITDEFTSWAKDNDIKIDIESVSDFLVEHPELSDDEIEDLYEYVTDNPTRREVRDYTEPLGDDWPETLSTQPKRLTPSLVFPADDDNGHRHEVVDVTKDDRKTTGPGQIVARMQRTAIDDEKMYNIMGLDAPAAKPLAANPFSGGGFDASKMPGVSGSPNNPTPPDPTGGLLPVGAGTTPSPVAPDRAAGDQSWWGGASSGAATPSTPSNSGTNGGGTNGGGVTGGGAAGGSNWTANDIAAGSIPTGQDYTIKPGDTLSEIAQGAGYGDNYQALFDQNKDSLTDPNKINAGDKLHIPGLDIPAAGAGNANATSGDVGAAAGGAPTGGTDTGVGATPPPTPEVPGGTPSVSVSPLTADNPSGMPALGAPDTSLTGLNPTGDLTNPGLTPKVSRYLYAEDFEVDPLDELRDISGERDLGNAEAHNDHVRKLVDELHDDYRMDASQMVAALEVEGDPHQGFTGSGSNPKYVWGTSQEYVDKNEKPHRVDVTDLGEGPMIRYTEKEAATDVVRRFHADLQREGSAIDGESSGGQYSDDAISARADAMIRTAGRKFSPREQRELEDESHPLGARNLPTEADLQGTHYVD